MGQIPLVLRIFEKLKKWQDGLGDVDTFTADENTVLGFSFKMISAFLFLVISSSIPSK